MEGRMCVAVGTAPRAVAKISSQAQDKSFPALGVLRIMNRHQNVAGRSGGSCRDKGRPCMERRALPTKLHGHPASFQHNQAADTPKKNRFTSPLYYSYAFCVDADTLHHEMQLNHRDTFALRTSLLEGK